MRRGKKETVKNQAFSQMLAHWWKCSLGAYLQPIHRMRVVGIHSFAVMDSMIPWRTQRSIDGSATTGCQDYAAE